MNIYKSSNSILLFSGGLDSSIAFFYLQSFLTEKPDLLHVYLGTKYSDIELKVVKKFSETFNSNLFISNNLNLGQWEESNANIQMRNSFLIMNASYYSSHIFLVVQKDEQSIPDRSPEFFNKITKYLNFLWKDKINKQLKRKFIIDPVFPHMTKRDMLKWFIKNFPDKVDSLLNNTFSCFQPRNGKACKSCSACMRYWSVFRWFGYLKDWDIEITKSESFKIYTKRAKIGDLGPNRSKEWLELIEIL